jgi:hypothetical protein
MFVDNQDSTRHIDDRNPLADADDQLNACAGSFHDGVGGTGTRDKNAGSVGTCSGPGFSYRIENRQVFNDFSTLAGSDATNYIGSGSHHVACVVLSFAPSYTLYNYACCIIQQNTHVFVFL